MALPRYQTLEEIPTPQGILLPGAIIDFEGSPGPHLYPMNAEARQRLEDWYQEWYEYDQALPDGSKVKVRHQPHLQFQQRYQEPSVQHPISVVSAPASLSPKGQSLAEVSAPGMGRSSNVQRPGPASNSHIRREFEEAETAPKEAEGEPEDLALVAGPPPPDPTLPGATIKTTRR
jgi:hypothetical protein